MMRRTKFGDSKIIRNDKTGEIPFLAEDAAKQMLVAARRNVL